MNEKMRNYLEEQFEIVSRLTANMQALLTVGTGYHRDISTIREHLTYIEHAVMESAKCEHCCLVGLTDNVQESDLQRDVREDYERNK
jgi:hypothetical protein